MARDYTKYNVEGLDENLNKRQLVFTVVKDYIEKNNPSFEDLQKAFPDEVQGAKGFVAKEAEIKDPKRFNMREPLKIKNGAHAVVSNQWGANIEDFIEVASNLGYTINDNNDQNSRQKDNGNQPSTEEKYNWSYEQKDSKQEFLDWLKEFEFPGDDFDYKLTYKRIFDDFLRFFPEVDPDHFDKYYTDIIDLNIGSVEESINEWYDNLDDEQKKFCAEEGYEDDSRGAMIALAGEFGEGSISSPGFIKNFNNLEDQRHVLGLYVASIFGWLWSDMGNDWDSKPDFWDEYQIGE